VPTRESGRLPAAPKRETATARLPGEAPAVWATGWPENNKRNERTNRMKTKRNIALAGLALALGAVVVITVGAGRGHEREPFKLGGSWVERYPGTPLLATYTQAPTDPSGRSAVLQGTAIITDPTLFGMFADAQYISAFVGEGVVTGPETAAHTTLWYGMKTGTAGPEVLYIALDSGTEKRIAPGKLEVTHNMAIYLPIQDQDGDGLPDEGQSPVFCLPKLVSIETRLPMLPPCKP
jgi:hypothetical protein